MRSESMKRFVMCVVLAAMVMGSICAEKTKIHGIGLSVPIEAQYWWHFDDVLLDETVSTVGINLNYKNMSVHGESWVGFSAIYEMQLGYSFGFISDENFSMLDALNLKWGWGVAFRPTDKIILAAHGTLGLDAKIAVGDNFLDFNSLTARIGDDVVFIYKCTNSFGISVEIDTYVPVMGYGSYSILTNKYRHGKQLRSQENYLIYGGIGCDLKFGVCWVY